MVLISFYLSSRDSRCLRLLFVIKCPQLPQPYSTRTERFVSHLIFSCLSLTAVDSLFSLYYLGTVSCRDHTVRALSDSLFSLYYLAVPDPYIYIYTHRPSL
ncbi:hypothetical protein RSOLAG1IB_11011 [Rhizoctonia solani AG-1 IB]|uniref:Uncharacterized protein n=1 Tax=Thanatephorus cucumeris (strain AG1-IB / isolate 7/3/14) TaxID=1108050 RepID=A0A0B7G6A3_THACB|nr:hypothetical protein RSOLAG1IB_11011 [Rhizoctonia solani AG-1 IB]